MRDYTRKTALLEAIEIVKAADLPQEQKNGIVKKLTLCVTELPFAKWSENAICDACDQFLLDHGRVPSISEFDRGGLPSHTVVRRRLGVSVREFRERYFREELEKQKETPDREIILRDFADEYKRLGVTTQKEYDQHRSAGQLSAQTILKYTGITSWLDLLKMAGIEPTRRKAGTKKKTSFSQFTVTVTYPWDKMMRQIEQKKDEVSA